MRHSDDKTKELISNLIVTIDKSIHVYYSSVSYSRISMANCCSKSILNMIYGLNVIATEYKGLRGAP